MLKHILKYAVGARDLPRIEAVNDYLLYESTPVLNRGVLYLDGEGTASGYIAKRAAEIFLTGEFNTVVIAGGRIPANDWKSKIVFPQLERDGLPLPQKGQNEADYMSDIFMRAVKEKSLLDISVFSGAAGNNTGTKIKTCAPLLSNSQTIQAVTLSYNQRRLHGTIRKELGDAPVISVEGVYPLGFTKENWDKNWLSYGVVMDEADKTGPRLDGKAPAYRKFFDDFDVAAEKSRIALQPK